MNILAAHTAPAPLECALVIVLTMSIAGFVHTYWLRSPWSIAFRVPLDAGRTWRGVRIFGDNKTLAGLMAIVPAAGVVLMSFGAFRGVLPAWIDNGLWAFSPPVLFALGCWMGLSFMAGELPNSFIKRRWGIAPGVVPASGTRRLLCLTVDRLDSTVALLIAMSLVAPLAWQTWVWVLLLGPSVHLAFSAALFVVGVKARPA